MLLETERLIIRHITENDWKSIKEIWENFNASEFSQYDIPHNIDDEDVRKRISKWAKANNGKGYAKESHLALFDYLRGLGITSFTASTAVNNKPSVSLLKALGFKQVGTEKVSFYKDSEGNDIVFDGGIFELTTR